MAQVRGEEGGSGAGRRWAIREGRHGVKQKTAAENPPSSPVPPPSLSGLAVSPRHCAHAAGCQRTGHILRHLPPPSQGLLYPLDTVRTRLAVSAQGTYSGIYSTLHRIWAEEGFRALYRGITPNMIGILVSVGGATIRSALSMHLGRKGSERSPWDHSQHDRRRVTYA